MKKCLLGVVVVLVALTAFIAAMGAATAGIEAVGTEEAKDLLAAVRLGCDAAASRVSTSAGQVRVHEWTWKATGELLEMETVYDVASAGEKFKASVTTTYLTNEWASAGFNAPGTVHREEVAYDGEKVTNYDPDRNRAEISGLDSDAGRQLRGLKAVVMIPGHGVPRAELEQVKLPPGYEWNERRLLGREVVDGEECIVYEASHTAPRADGTEVTYYHRHWINPQRQFTVSKSESGIRGGPYGEGFVLATGEAETRQYADGLWSVREVRIEEHRLDDSGNPYRMRYAVTTFADDYQLNGPVSEDMLTIKLPSGTKVYNTLIDACLLYTSPSPRDRQRSRMPSSA